MSGTVAIGVAPSTNIPPSGNGPGSPDPVALTSDVGTWVAAFIAIIALVGIIGPYLALQASVSDSNRVMNAVQAIPEKYISRGFRVVFI
jgi:hypothetical protein